MVILYNYLSCVLHCRERNVGLAIAAAALVILAAFSSLAIPEIAMAKKGTPFQAGYDHGCSDSKLAFPARYMNQPGKGPSFHTLQFMSGYKAGFSSCSSSSNSHKPSSSPTPTLLYEQGYTKGVLDAKSHQMTFPLASTAMSTEDVDCDSDIDPKASNADYCSGYQHGFADAHNNNALPTKTTTTTSELPAAKSPPSSAQVAAPSPNVCSDGPAPDINGKCSPISQAPTDQGTTMSTTTPQEDHKGSNQGGSLLSSSNNNPVSPPSVDNNNNNNNNNDNKSLKQHEVGKETTSSRPALTDHGTE